MEANQRRYTRNLNAEIMISPREPLTEEQIRRALVERRTIIGPNGEKFDIPKHMSLNDMVRYFKSEFGLTHAEVTQVVAAAEMLTLRPDYRGKLNRVVMDGAENPLRIEIPGKRPVDKLYQPVQELISPKEVVVQQKVTSKVEVTQEKNAPKIENRIIPASRPKVEPEPTLEIFVKNPSRDGVSRPYYGDNIVSFNAPRRQTRTTRVNSYTVQNPESARREEINVNGIVADRMRAGRAEERRIEAQRAEQNKNLEKQMRAHYQEQVRIANRKRRNRLAIVATVAFLWATGLVVDVLGLTNDINKVGNDLEPIGIHENAGNLFEVTPQTISNFTGDINLIPTSQRTNGTVVTTLNEYQSWESAIDIASQGLNANSNLSNVLNKYSRNSRKSNCCRRNCFLSRI